MTIVIRQGAKSLAIAALAIIAYQYSSLELDVEVGIGLVAQFVVEELGPLLLVSHLAGVAIASIVPALSAIYSFLALPPIGCENRANVFARLVLTVLAPLLFTWLLTKWQVVRPILWGGYAVLNLLAATVLVYGLKRVCPHPQGRKNHRDDCEQVHAN